MGQMSDGPKMPGEDQNMYSKMPYGGRDAGKMKDLPMDSNPEAKKAMKDMFDSRHMAPGVGLGTQTWSPDAGIQRERQRRMAQGATAQERMALFQEAGVKDDEGMRKVFERAYTSPEKAFMLARKG